jgi:trimeric autotransporter adhesin
MKISLFLILIGIMVLIAIPVAATDVINQGTNVYIQENSLSVVKGNPFAITLIGRPLTHYYLGIINPAINDNPPEIDDNQDGVVFDNGTSHYFANITTDNDGSRIIQFTTNYRTKAQRYQIIAKSGNNSDDVEITVVKGAVTIGIDGDTYLGENIKLIGTSTEAEKVYLFITGINLPVDGASINSLDPRNHPVINDDISTFQVVDVMGDNTWSWDWGTSTIALDTGIYTIYVSTQPHNVTNLYNDTYNTVGIDLKKSYISIFSTTSSVAQGDDFIINGIASGDPSIGIHIWIFGKNYMKHDIVSVDKDGVFIYEIKGDITKDLGYGEYFVVAQHPMQNNIFDVYIENESIYNKQMGISLFKLTGPGSLQGIDAAAALVDALESQNIDDVYTKFSFYVDVPEVTIEEVNNTQVLGDFIDKNVTISKTILQTLPIPTPVPTVEITIPVKIKSQPGFGAVFCYNGVGDCSTYYCDA